MSSALPYVFVADVGGTFLRTAVFGAVDQQLHRVARQTTTSYWNTPEATAADLLQRLYADLDEAFARAHRSVDLAGACIALCGPIDAAGRVTALPPLLGRPLDVPEPMSEHLRARWQMRNVYVINDMTAAGLALTKAHDGATTSMLLTVGSGVGMRAFLGDRPILGSNAQAGEIGHIRVDWSEQANPCDCGSRGHLSSLASGRGVVSTLRRKALVNDVDDIPQTNDAATMDGFSVARAYHQGDHLVRSVVDASAVILGRILGVAVAVIDPADVYMIGGFALGLGESYLRTVVRRMTEAQPELSTNARTLNVVLADQEGIAGLRGAGRYAASMISAHR
jgi:predicted NBD/HSP70 family sugar kinase